MHENSDNDRQQNQSGEWLAQGLAIGAGFGVALGLVLDNLALGIAIGCGMGMAVGAALGMRNRSGALCDPASARASLGILVIIGVAVLLLVVGLTLLALLRAG